MRPELPEAPCVMQASRLPSSLCVTGTRDIGRRLAAPRAVGQASEGRRDAAHRHEKALPHGLPLGRASRDARLPERAASGFPAETEGDTIYLVGDIVDGWRLKQSWYWPQEHNDVDQKLLRKVRKHVRLVYIPGNHDEF